MNKLTIAAATALALASLAPAPVLADEPAAATIGADRLDAARQTVDHIFPLGTYARVMDKTMDAMMGPMMEGMADLPLRDLARMGGLSEEDLAEMGEGTMSEVMAILDPAYKERMDRSMRVMMSEMGGLMSRFEPAIREGLAEAYAKRFSPGQLAELNAFFATPTGSAYAADSMVIFMDPDVMSKMQAFVPEMMEEMPTLMAKVGEATKDIPPPRKYSELSDADREKLSKLLGVPADELGREEAGED
ncbi:MAG: DUF2059 domain-containing protein [Sphingomonadaceae bacterium]|jgi:hypothetical protein